MDFFNYIVNNLDHENHVVRLLLLGELITLGLFTLLVLVFRITRNTGHPVVLWFNKITKQGCFVMMGMMFLSHYVDSVALSQHLWFSLDLLITYLVALTLAGGIDIAINDDIEWKEHRK